MIAIVKCWENIVCTKWVTNWMRYVHAPNSKVDGPATLVTGLVSYCEVLESSSELTTSLSLVAIAESAVVMRI
jgi:hypothetical protein